MSYSFSAKGSTKDAALADATRQLDAAIDQQPVHSKDREAALSNLRAHLALAKEPADSEAVTISMHGSISTNSDGNVTSVGSGCNVSVYTRPVAA